MLGLVRPVYQPSGRSPVSCVCTSIARAMSARSSASGTYLIVDPAPAVRGDLVPGLQEGLHHRRIALHRQRDAEHGQRNIVALEQPQQPPDAGARRHIRRSAPCSCAARPAPARHWRCRRGRPRRPGRRRAHWPRRLPHSSARTGRRCARRPARPHAAACGRSRPDRAGSFLGQTHPLSSMLG